MANSNETIVVLPARDYERIRLVAVPADFSERDAVRQLTALIAELQEEEPGGGWEALAQRLEDRGFRPVTHVLGPSLDE